MDDERAGFTTARELRETAGRRDDGEVTTDGERDACAIGAGGSRSTEQASDGPAVDEPAFDVDHPTREFSRTGGMRYEGGTVFVLAPRETDCVAGAVEDILDAEPYRYGDWFDLPMPLFLVHDDEVGDTFRVAVRGETVELHVRSATSPAGLRSFYRRLDARIESTIEVTRKANRDGETR